MSPRLIVDRIEGDLVVFGLDHGEPVPEEEARLQEATERLKRLAARSADLPDEIEL